MAPFEHQREALHSVHPLRDDSMDELRIEERSYQKGSMDNKHDNIDFYGNYQNYFDDYPLPTTAAATSTSASVTPTSSIVYGSRTTQLPSSVCLAEYPSYTTTNQRQISLSTSAPLTTSSMPTTTRLSLSASGPASSSQVSKGLDPRTSDYAMSIPTPSLAVYSTSSSHTTSSAAAALGQTAATTTNTLAPVATDVGNHSLSPTAQHVLISAATIGMFCKMSVMHKI
jgi:hypothetical protein